MKLCLIGKNPNSISRRVAKEGDSVVTDAHDTDIFLIDDGSEIRYNGITLKDHQTIITGGFKFPTAFLNSMGVNVQQYEPTSVTHFFSKWFSDQSFSDQTILGLPIFGLMNENLGPQINVGCGVRFVNTAVGNVPFSQPEVQVVFKEWKFRGFVTFVYNKSNLVGVETGLPFFAFHNILEHITGRLSDWFVNPKKLYEAWSLTSLISRYPFPAINDMDSVLIEGVTPQIEKHLSLFDTDVIRRNVYVRGGEVGVAANWANRLSLANQFLLETCRAVKVEGKQYRTDLGKVVEDRYRYLKEHEII